MELKYFDGPGRGEPIRILLHAANVDWKDTRFDFSMWHKFQPTTPLGCVPTLTMDGTEFCQSMALERYVASLVGLYPKDDPLRALIVDEVMDTLNELGDKIPKGSTDEETKERREAFQVKEMSMYLGLVESRIQQFGGPMKNTICGVATVADIHLLVAIRGFQSGYWQYIDMTFLDQFLGISACVDAIANHDIVKGYYASMKRN